MRNAARKVVRLARPDPWRRFATVGEGSRVKDASLTVARDSSSRSIPVVVGGGSMLQCSISVEQPGATIEIGSNTFIGGGTVLSSADSIWVGDDVLISFDVLIFDHDSHALDWKHRRDDVWMWMEGRKDWSMVSTGPVQIGSRSWIGARAMILKGVHVGTGAVVAAGAIVTTDVEPNTLVAGVPARRIRSVSETDVPGRGGDG